MGDDTIAAVMQTDFLRLRPEMPMRDAVARMLAGHSTAAPVIDATGHLVGILTLKDCFGPAMNAAYYERWSDTVAHHMTAEVATLDRQTGLIAAAEAFRSTAIRSFPVVETGRVVGMLSRADLLRVFLRYG